MSLLTAEQLELLSTQPIPGENPGGANVRLESAFESIEREIAKLDSLTAEEYPRWRDVLATSQDILQNKSKDLLVICYLTRALCEADVIDGLEQGLKVANGIVGNFWEHAYPPAKRVRGRAQAFEWLVEKTLPLMDKYQPSIAHLDKIKNLEESVIGLDNTLAEKMGDAAPNLADFRQRFRRLRQGLEMDQQASVRRADPNPPTQAVGRHETVAQNLSEAVAENSAAQVPQIPPAGTLASDKDIIAIYRAVQDPLRSVSQFLRNKNLTDPEAFRINRFVTWLGIVQLPPAADGKTQLKPVPKDKVNNCQAMLAQQRWPDVLNELETSLSRAPYWLDGHRWVCEALQALRADDAVDAVKEGVRGFVARFPAVVNYSFSDGTPFADEQTRQWLKRELNGTGSSVTSSGVNVDVSGLSQQWLEAYELATQLAQQKQLREALALFQQGCSQSASMREQALWRFNQARFCFENNLVQLALPLLENLDRQLTENGVEEWEPQITCKVLQLLLRCYGSMAAAEVSEKRVELLHARLCKLDLALAFDLTKH